MTHAQESTSAEAHQEAQQAQNADHRSAAAGGVPVAANAAGAEAAPGKPVIPSWFAFLLGAGALYLLAKARADSAAAYEVEVEGVSARPDDNPGEEPSLEAVYAELRRREDEQMQSWGTAYPRPDNPPKWVDDKATWQRAKAQVQPYWSAYDQPWAVVATVYREMGGT
jgi:hypothetical protein